MASWMRRAAMVVSCVTAAVALAACGGSSGSSSDGGGTVPVDVGLDEPVNLKKGDLSVGIFMNAMTNKYQQVLAEEAKGTAESFGWQAKILDFNYDQQAMMNAFQSAATNQTYDVIFVNPIDGVGSCEMLTKTMPAADVLTVINSQTICDRDAKPLEEMWAPGTLAFLGITAGVDYSELFIDNAIKEFPGPQKVAFVTGPPEAGITKLFKKLLEEKAEADPNFDFQGFIYTDFTSPSAFAQTQNFLQANPDTTLLLNNYSPDLSRGMVQAMEAQGVIGDVKMADLGAAEYSVEEIKKGSIQMSAPLYPVTIGEAMVQAVKNVQDGNEPVRVPDYVPGGIDNAPVVTQDNVDSFEPQY